MVLLHNLWMHFGAAWWSWMLVSQTHQQVLKGRVPLPKLQVPLN